MNLLLTLQPLQLGTTPTLSEAVFEKITNLVFEERTTIDY